MIWILALLRRVPFQAWIGLACAVLVGLVLWAVHHDGYKAGQAEGQAKLAAHLQADAKALAKARADAETDRKTREAKAADLWAAQEKRNADALAEQNRLIAGLRAGTVRLRHEWAGCRSADGAGESARPDSADLRATGAANLIGNADRADSEITYLHGLIRSAPDCFTVGQ